MTHRRILIAIAAFLLSVPSILAVTDGEMEQARVIATQCYLRYANNGSGYLDDLHPKTMKELESALKAKEKENIKAFKAIQVPADYASWDKKKLVEFWGTTAFNASGLLPEGKAARSRVKARIGSMSVSAPAAPEEAAKPEAKDAGAVDESAPVSVPDPQGAQEAVAAAENVADSIAAADKEDLELTSVKKEDSSTWIYVAILVVLVIVVVVLVVYAARTMKVNAARNNGPLEPTVSVSSLGEETDALREKFGKALASKNEELTQASAAASSQRERAEMLKRRLEEAEAEIAVLRSENTSLRDQLAEAKSRASEHSGESPRETAPRRRTIYLGRVNSRGIFVRADRNFDPAHDIYCLETADGITGSFYVAQDRTLAEMASLTPMEALGGGCEIGNAAAGHVSEIVTDMRGTAVFESGCWRVGRKARVSFR